ncbi:hypothetical protein CF328_g9294, partial [Tilletia controversa]
MDRKGRMAEEVVSLVPFQKWLEKHDVRFHPALYFARDATCGMSVFTREDLPTGACAIDLPADLPITSAFSRAAIMDLFVEVSDDGEVKVSSRTAERVDEGRQREQSLADGGASALARLTRHAPYIQAIPYPQIALTPLHFNATELNLLRGTSLHGATLERRLRGEQMVSYLFAWLARHATDTQHGSMGAILADATSNEDGSEEIKRLWRWADTSFGSRSFPPRIIGLSDEKGEAAFGAVLIPGLDSFHQRGRPVTWKYDPPEQDTTGRTKLILDSSTSANSQVFNNYGAKSVEELFGSYG